MIVNTILHGSLESDDDDQQPIRNLYFTDLAKVLWNLITTIYCTVHIIPTLLPPYWIGRCMLMNSSYDSFCVEFQLDKNVCFSMLHIVVSFTVWKNCKKHANIPMVVKYICAFQVNSLQYYYILFVLTLHIYVNLTIYSTGKCCNNWKQCKVVGLGSLII